MAAPPDKRQRGRQNLKKQLYPWIKTPEIIKQPAQQN